MRHDENGGDFSVGGCWRVLGSFFCLFAIRVAPTLAKVLAYSLIAKAKVVIQTTGPWKRIFACTCRQELTHSLVICGMTKMAGVSALAGVGSFVCLFAFWVASALAKFLAYSRKQ